MSNSPAAVPLRRRVDRTLLRWEARLETETGDRFVPFIVAGALGGLLAWLALARLDAYDTGADLAGYAQALWLLGEGNRPEITVFGGIHLLELHWSLILYPLTPLALVFDPLRVLVAVQAAALGLAVLPLWKLARQVCQLRVGAAITLVLAYAVHPATWQLGSVDFHPESLAVPGLIAMLYAGAARRWGWYWLAVAFVLACRADLGLAIAAYGFVLLSDGERRAGLWSLGTGLFWSLSLLLVVQPLVGDAEFAGGQYADYGGSLAEVALTMVRHPDTVLADMAAEGNVVLVVGLLAPVIFLPLLAIRHLLPALPLLALYLLTDRVDASATAERSALLLAFVMGASAFALERVGDMGVDRVFVDGRIQAAVLLASSLFFLTQSPTSPYRQPWQWEPGPADRAVTQAVARLGPEVAVRASPSALVALAERPWLYELDPERALTAPAASARARAVLVVTEDHPGLDEDRLVQLTTGLSQLGYEVTYRSDTGVTLYERP